jgi:CRISPR-associated exonuclease Cas4
MPVGRRATYAMAHGRIEQARLEKLELRRTLGRYGLEEGRREFGLVLRSALYALSGKLDLAVVTSDGAYRPVDFKWTEGAPARNHRAQVAAYAMLLEDVKGGTPDRGFVVTLPSQEVYDVDVNRQLREDVTRCLVEIRDMIAHQKMPGRADSRNKCDKCEFRNYCGDVF